MTSGRRKTGRRRRVLYTTHHADNAPLTAASRRAAERLREARRPTAAYGVRVQRRLRGRWFSVVPVRRRTMIFVAIVVTAISLLLGAAHYAAVAWPSIAYHPEIARPLRLDRPDSFGRWVTLALLGGSVGASLLIYQLRRYSIDDYQGRYRVWRLVIMVLVFASVNSLASLVDWGGAILDVGVGRRVALSGSDWIRLFVTLGGAILALRLIAEVRRSRWALVTMITACCLLGIHESAKWSFIKVESVTVWALVTSAPLMAFTMLFLSLGGYLRLLYREVRQINDGDSLSERVQRFGAKVLQRSEGAPSDDTARIAASSRTSEAMDDERVETDHRDDAQSSEPPRRWLGLRRAKSEPTKDRPDGTGQPRSGQPRSGHQQTDQTETTKSPKQRRRFSMRPDSTSQNTSPEEGTSGKKATSGQKSKRSDAAESSDSKPKRGLGSWFRSNKSAPPETEPHREERKAPAVAPTPEPVDEPIDSGDIDWDSMSKSERRRLRKKLRRDNRAA